MNPFPDRFLLQLPCAREHLVSTVGVDYDRSTMNTTEPSQPSSWVSTQWPLLEGARQRNSSAIGELYRRYAPAARAYLSMALGNRPEVDDLVQELGLKFLNGSFDHVQPRENTRFRTYLKTVLARMVIDYHRQFPAEHLIPDLESHPGPIGLTNPSTAYERAYAAQLIEQTWRKLASDDGHPMYTLLRIKVDHPDLTSEEIANRLATPEWVPTAGWVRTTLFRVRNRFAEHLIAVVANTVDNPTNQTIAEELLAVGLFNDVVHQVLVRRSKK